jgi:hypothetical protein
MTKEYSDISINEVIKEKAANIFRDVCDFSSAFFPDSKRTDDDDVICEKLCGVAPTSFGRGGKNEK